MSLYLVRIPTDLGQLARMSGERGWTRGRRQVFDEGAALHHLLSETFGPRVLQPFRLVVAPRQRAGRVYAYTHRSASDLQGIAATTALPEIRSALAWDALEEKAMPTHWQMGQRIGFDVRLRPTVRLSTAIESRNSGDSPPPYRFKKGAELDAFLAEALKHTEPDGMAQAGRTREKVYSDWVAKRFGTAADIEHVELVRFARSTARRGEKAHEAPDVVMHGTLQIRDADRFVDLLNRGVGRHKAYGYGMLLLRPPRPHS